MAAVVHAPARSAGSIGAWRSRVNSDTPCKTKNTAIYTGHIYTYWTDGQGPKQMPVTDYWHQPRSGSTSASGRTVNRRRCGDVDERGRCHGLRRRRRTSGSKRRSSWQDQSKCRVTDYWQLPAPAARGSRGRAGETPLRWRLVARAIGAATCAPSTCCSARLAVQW